MAVARTNEAMTQQVIVLGAGRSGTTLLLDVLASHPQIDALPSDINFVWTYGNPDHEDDQLPPGLARPEVRSFIRRYFKKYSTGRPFQVEKSVCNTVRLPFVLRVFPQAKILYVQRDGRDVVESVLRNWLEVRDWAYRWKKIKAFPLLAAFPYAWRYAVNFLKIKLGRKPADDYIWGVRYPGFREDLKAQDTLTVVAKQWAYCVEQSLDDLAALPREQWLEVRYEDFVRDPKAGMARIAAFLGIDGAGFDLSEVNADTVGRHRRGLREEQLAAAMPMMEKTLRRAGYEVEKKFTTA